MPQTQSYKWIPTYLALEQFETFVLPHLHMGSRGLNQSSLCMPSLNYILKLLHLGCQWQELPIEKDKFGRPEVHHSSIYRAFRRFETHGCFEDIVKASVALLHEQGFLDTIVIYGDGTTTAAKKSGDNLGFNGHKHMKWNKVVAFCDRNCNIISSSVTAPGNRNESPLFKTALSQVMSTDRTVGIDLTQTIVSLDGAYDSRDNQKMIFNRGMVPNINENPRGRKKPKRGPKRLFNPSIFQERFCTIERVFAWEDKFKRLLLRFERISRLHYALKSLAYTMINLRHFCQG